MSQGPEHVEAALQRIESAAEKLVRLEGLEEGWRGEAAAKLAAAGALLRATQERFFLKTRVCLPFARKCEEEAGKLEALLAELGAQPTPDAQQQVTAALQALERAAKTLDERSLMQGMAIT